MSLPAAEPHFTASAQLRDLIIGMSDGLTVPFALAAGLTGAVHNSGIIVTAGVAEIAAGSIAMGLGGYLSAKSDAEHYAIERVREECEVVDVPASEEEEVYEVFSAYGLSREESQPVVAALQRQPQAWVDFMMRFELGLEKPDPARAVASAATIALAYILGGLVPLFPYIFIAEPLVALRYSVVLTMLALLFFGLVKARVTGSKPFKSGMQTLFTGTIAAMAAYFLARLISA